MKSRLHSSLLLTLLFAWLSMQTAALVHEYSNEHLLASDHYCITHSVHNDSLAVGHSLEIHAVIEFALFELAQPRSSIHYQHIVSFNPRAPPNNA